MTDITHITDRERAQAAVILALESARDEMAKRIPQWISVDQAMPQSGQTVLACYKNSAGNWRRIRAEWVDARAIVADTDSEISEYDPLTDEYYDPAGWYERIDNWDMYSSVAVVEGVVSHWMPLPPPPTDKPIWDQLADIGASDPQAWEKP